MAGKFAKEASRFNLDLGALFNRSIRAALLAGLEVAVKSTYHDSSNAAVHWAILAVGSRIGRGRKIGRINDFRGTNSRSPVLPVGYRDDAGENAVVTLRYVRDRELREVVDRLVAGRHPSTKFFFNHPLETDSVYAARADIEQAGQSALAATEKVFLARIAAGQSRKNPL